MPQIEEDIAARCGLSVEVVSQVLQEIRKVAIDNVAHGFTLPGFGRFSIENGPESKGINPFTGQPCVFKERPFVSFKVDPTIERSFVMGEDQTKIDADKDAAEYRELPQIRLHPDAEQVRAAGLSASSAAASNFKLGGHPDWIQGPQDVVCCNKRSTFYGQLDSRIGGDFNVADAGMIYVFICDDCLTSRGVVQFY